MDRTKRGRRVPTPWSTALVEKLIKKSITLYGSQRFIFMLTTVRKCPYQEPDESSPQIPIPFL
jgi:hypothetical protein